jgi:pimeloyl-ACP methyl ester carboxylesterase
MTKNLSLSSSASAVDADTRLVEVGGRKLAYRVVGTGRPLVLCNRFRGILDSWDPAFIDALARHFTVVTFDFSGFGRSTGTPSYDPSALANDARDLIGALDLGPVVVGGWSIGGTGVQVLITEHPGVASHAVLIATAPPGEIVMPPERLFFERALKPVNDLDDETVLFFEPASASSRAAAVRSHERIAQRKTDLSPAIPTEVFMRLLEGKSQSTIFEDLRGTRERLKKVTIPLMNIAGDHDIVMPVENWYARIKEMPDMQTIVYSHAGHGPQHELPEASAEYIATFVRTTSSARQR